MANGERCRHCGFQETDHINPHYRPGAKICKTFDDGVQHIAGCPGSPQCSGDCEVAIARVRGEREVQEEMWRRTET